MRKYQTILYKAIYINEKIGWDIEKRPIFKSRSTEDPGLAIQEFDFHEPIHANWIAAMRMIEDGKVVEEEWFDSSVIDVEYK